VINQRHSRCWRNRCAVALIPSSARLIIAVAWSLVLTLWAAPTAAEIFKCVGKNGAALYQNFPCHIDSLGSLPANPPGSKTPLPPGDTSDAKPNPASVVVAATGTTARVGEPRIGMTIDEVRALWGEPVETFEEELKEGRTELWRYGDNRSVRFNHKRRVLAVER
jgi:hypothetical protein